MEDYITIKLTRKQAIELASDMAESSNAFRLAAVQANQEFTHFKSEYFQDRLAEAQYNMAQHNIVWEQMLNALVEAGIHYDELLGGYAQ